MTKFNQSALDMLHSKATADKVAAITTLHYN